MGRGKPTKTRPTDACGGRHNGVGYEDSGEAHGVGGEHEGYEPAESPGTHSEDGKAAGVDGQKG